MTTAGVLLAAGGGRRFPGPGHKLLAPFRGRPLVAASLGALRDAGFDEVAVVVGAIDLRHVIPPDAVVLENPRWKEGIATSLRVATAWGAARRHDVLVVGLGDMPGVPTAAWRAVGAATAPVAVACFAGHATPPVRLGAEVWDLLPTTGDIGARALWQRAGAERVVCDGDPSDVDTPIDLARLDAPPPARRR